MVKKTYFKKAKKSVAKSKYIVKSKTIPRSMLNTHHFKNHKFIKNWLSIDLNGTDQGFNYNFTLSDLVNTAEYTALYDRYRINYVVMKLIPRYNTNLILVQGLAQTTPSTTNNLATANYGLPEIMTAIDYDSATTPASINDIMEYRTYKRTLGTKEHIRSLKPRLLVDSSNIGVSMAKKWIDCDKPNVPHYGVIGMITNIPSTTVDEGAYQKYFIDLDITYYISMRDSK